MFKKLVLLILLINLLSMALPINTVFATTGMGSALNKTAEQAEIEKNQNLAQFIGGLVQTFLGLVGLIFIILMVYAGTIWMTSMGDPKKIEKAKNIIKASIIGLLIIIISYSIAYYITSSLEAAN